VGRDWPSLAPRLAGLGLAAETVLTHAPGHATELAARAVADGHELVVVVGGDGTLCEAAAGLYRAGGGRLAMLPLGTGNDAARTLGVPLELEAAVGAALDGRRRAVDLIRVGDEVVVNAIGIGLTGDINRRAARLKKVRGIAAYLVTATISMVRFPTPVVRLETPDVVWQGPITLIAVHNGPTTGGGFRLTPGAEPDDGHLDVTLVPGLSVLGRPPRLLAAMAGRLGRMRGTVEVRAPWLELAFTDPLPAHLDGNQVLLEPPSARFEVLPGALTIQVAAEPCGTTSTAARSTTSGRGQ